jgi:hypothetical protein
MSSDDPAVREEDAVEDPSESDPGWWVPAAVVIGFFLLVNYVWIGFLGI